MRAYKQVRCQSTCCTSEGDGLVMHASCTTWRPPDAVQSDARHAAQHMLTAACLSRAPA